MAHSPARRILWTLLTLALLLKAFVPMGYMPDTDALARGMMRIKICTAVGSQQIWVDKNLKKIDPAQHQDKPRYDGDCVFATGLHFTPEYNTAHLSELFFAPLLISFRAIASLIPVIFNPAAPARAGPAAS